MPALMRLLASPDGTSAAEAGMALGKSKQSALNYLTALRERGIAVQAGAGRGHRWHAADAEPPAAPEAIPAPSAAAEPEPRPYLTLENLAEFVLKGLAEADDEQRAVLEQAHDLIRRQRLRLVEDDRDDTP
jgi:biotin operon repressor